MKTCPITLAQAAEFVGEFHRHHKAPIGHRFSIGAEHGGKLVGVVVVGRPVARKTPQYTVAEVTRLCTDGTKNACSFLYSVAARVTKEMGFDRIQTFILPSESGVSLKAAGWRFDGVSNAATWQTRAGRRQDQPTEPKHRFVKEFKPKPPAAPLASDGEKGEDERA
jgi:hypothetical protein